MALFPSDTWVKEFVDRINASPSYEEAAATWEGDICFVFEAQPDMGLDNDVWAWMDLWHGKCRDYRYELTPEEGRQARFVIRAPYPRWKDVIRKDLDPIKGMVTGKLRLKGDIFTMLRHVKAATEFVNIAATVPTEFVGERQ